MDSSVTSQVIAPFYGKTRRTRQIVKIDDTNVVYNQKGEKIGICSAGVRACHSGVDQQIHLVDGSKDTVIALWSNRDKRAEAWHRWASLGRDPEVLHVAGICSARRTFMRGKCSLPADQFGRPATTMILLIEKVW